MIYKKGLNKPSSTMIRFEIFISQMIVCAENEADINPRNTKYNGTKDARRFQLLGGLAPPLKNVKKRRFRKIIRKRHCEAPEVEKELKQLLRQDMGKLKKLHVRSYFSKK